ncbi:hypothetical protein MA03_00895 [Infirmifilum uzonense]|uniref:Methyltransferase type 11 domain-containing protein n=1 Tax=Infirmifilum uzonense TaxID=1550241 RepID=A0A0F7FHE0_9CREN|nr:class I SAM-dependent methyltransferase [Infirmifilum uzonense]AKG38138.1 hypothetical protein MA03_00895 [Infirmifilum uzonense]
MGTTGLSVKLWLQVEEVLRYLFDEDIYERANTAMSLGLHKLLREYVLSMVTNTILDVGCGKGEYIPYLAKKSDFLVCLDPILPRFNSKHPKMDRAVGVAEYLPFRDGAFYFATAMFSFRDFFDKAKGIYNLRRVVKRGALILDLFSPSYILRPLLVLYFGVVAPAMGCLATGCKKGRWELILPTILLMPRSTFFERIGGKIMLKKAYGLVAIVYLPPYF